MVVRSNQENVPLSTPSTRKEPRRLCRTRRKKGPSMSDWSRHRRLVAVRWRALFEVFELDLAIWGLGLVNCASVPWLRPPIKAKWAESDNKYLPNLSTAPPRLVWTTFFSNQVQNVYMAGHCETVDCWDGFVLMTRQDTGSIGDGREPPS